MAAKIVCTNIVVVIICRDKCTWNECGMSGRNEFQDIFSCIFLQTSKGEKVY